MVRRVAAAGGWREMSLLRSRVGDQAIRDVIERTEARGLSPQRIRFWQLLLGLPARRADAWVRRERESTWARRYRRSVDFDWTREDSIDDPLRPAASEDIAAMKLAAVAQRGSKKDFIDVFALGRHFGLGDMLVSYRKKYGVEDVGHVLVALAYFDDADRERTPMLLQRQSWPDVKATIRGWLAGATRGRR